MNSIATAPATLDDALVHLRAGVDNQAAEFRDGQWKIIDELVNARGRVLAVQATGWGKSMVYFVATKLLRERGFGTTIIVSPLLALMRNQLAAAERLGLKTIAWTSENKDDWPRFEQELLAGTVDILLVSPERLANADFRGSVLTPMLERQTFFVVDEAHCISEWGHDFRPDYQRIRGLLQRMPAGVPVLGTTATANDRVTEDVLEQFGAGTKVTRGSLVRRSLTLQAMPPADKARRLAWLAQHLDELPGSGIIYVLTKRDADQVAGFLERREHKVRPYYSRGGFGENLVEEDAELERMLLDGEIKALVATTKLGMGFDKPDLGFVIHYQLPSSVIAYYQQIGRAGRAIEDAVCVVMTGEEDRRINEYFIKNAVPERANMERVVAVLDKNAGGANRGTISRLTDLTQGRVDQVLTHLNAQEPPPVTRSGTIWRRTHEPLVYDEAEIEMRKARKRAEFETMVELTSPGSECMMQPILIALDDHTAPARCGKCAHCVGHPIVDISVDDSMIEQVQRELRYLDMPIAPRKMWPPQFTQDHGVSGKLSAGELVETGRVLCSWGDPGFAGRVRTSLETGVLDPAVVAEFAALASERWKQVTDATWVTWIPSTTRDDVIRALVEAVASAGVLRIVEPLRRVDQRAPQTTKHTSWHQASNVFGAFAVDESQIPDGESGILIDDTVDSKWTFTVVGRQLRLAGASAVYPLALVDTSGADMT